ncbi:hypothetical protein RFI_00898 [Reticulomyxa filosa]|uniref:Transmembrane protein n=1 Tax=Reticulomyxa filosa TaxID=46433 RepID=X6PDM9_RETFI|nr:hypothetical protein RFI_00898 [Reticulomyxa filosa]|eukprot:ETO36164.1 hypothetical protein RFI_00898 [Reticulomyxa filosa]
MQSRSNDDKISLVIWIVVALLYKKKFLIICFLTKSLKIFELHLRNSFRYCYVAVSNNNVWKKKIHFDKKSYQRVVEITRPSEFSNHKTCYLSQAFLLYLVTWMLFTSQDATMCFCIALVTIFYLFTIGQATIFTNFAFFLDIQQYDFYGTFPCKIANLAKYFTLSNQLQQYSVVNSKIDSLLNGFIVSTSLKKVSSFLLYLDFFPWYFPTFTKNFDYFSLEILNESFQNLFQKFQMLPSEQEKIHKDKLTLQQPNLNKYYHVKYLILFTYCQKLHCSSAKFVIYTSKKFVLNFFNQILILTD